MDSIRVSEAPDTGSIPVEATTSAEALAKADFFLILTSSYLNAWLIIALIGATIGATATTN